MTIVTTLSICLAVVCAFLLGRSAVISNRRYNRNTQLKAEVKKLNHRLDSIADSSKYDRYYEIEEDECAEVYNVNMNGHSAESYTVVWLFKSAIEKAGSTDGAAVRDALAELSIDGAFEGGRKIVLPYSKIEFAPEYEIGGAKHYRDNTYASVAIAQVQDQEWKTVWPFEFASSKIQEVTLG